MSTTITPPPLPPAPIGPEPTPAPQPGPGTRGSSRIVAILTIVFGAIIVLGALGWAVVATVAGASVRTETRTLAVPGVDGLDVDLSAGTLRVEFADVAEAELQVRGAYGVDQWTFAADGDDLVVASPRGMFGGWLLGGHGEAVLRLPQSLSGIDGSLDLSAGDLTVVGAFRELDVQVSAGSAELVVTDASSADLSVSAGSLDTEFLGAAPDSLDVSVSAGSASIIVPEGRYDVTSDVSAGDFDNRIGSDAGAANRVHVEVSAGEVVLRTAR